MTRAMKQVDVFTAIPYTGNPVAVVLDGDGLGSEQMQRIANWTNLSETVFVLSASDARADYRVRIFTPLSELPFAGHPTIGTAHALLEAGLVTPKHGRLMQECEVGLVPVLVVDDEADGRIISFYLPAAGFGELTAVQSFALGNILHAPALADQSPLMVNVGPSFVVVQLQSADAVLDLSPDLAALTRFSEAHGVAGVLAFGPHPEGDNAAIEARAFFPILGINEDPVCGSGNGAIAAFIAHTGQVETFGAVYLSTQGQKVGRAGTIRIAIEQDGAIKVGGQSVTCIDGRIAV